MRLWSITETAFHMTSALSLQSLKLAVATAALLAAAPGLAPKLPFAAAIAAQVEKTKTKPPFMIGEVLDFRVNVSRGGDVGRGQMRVEGPEFDRGILTWRLVFVMNAGKGPIRATDRTTSWLDPERFTTTRFEKNERHPLSTNEERIEIDGLAGTWQLGDGPLQQLAAPLPLDELSFLYFLRTLPLDQDSTFTFTRHFDDARNPTVVHVRGEEIVQTPLGTFKTRVLDMHVRDPRRYRGAGVIRLNIDTGACHLLIRMVSRMPIVGTTTLTLVGLGPGAPPADVGGATCPS